MQRPAKNKADGKRIEELWVNAIVKGMKIPMSPREPEISERVNCARKCKGGGWR